MADGFPDINTPEGAEFHRQALANAMRIFGGAPATPPAPAGTPGQIGGIAGQAQAPMQRLAGQIQTLATPAGPAPPAPVPVPLGPSNPLLGNAPPKYPAPSRPPANPLKVVDRPIPEPKPAKPPGIAPGSLPIDGPAPPVNRPPAGPGTYPLVGEQPIPLAKDPGPVPTRSNAGGGSAGAFKLGPPAEPVHVIGPEATAPVDALKSAAESAARMRAMEQPVQAAREAAEATVKAAAGGKPPTWDYTTAKTPPRPGTQAFADYAAGKVPPIPGAKYAPPPKPSAAFQMGQAVKAASLGSVLGKAGTAAVGPPGVLAAISALGDPDAFVGGAYNTVRHPINAAGDAAGGVVKFGESLPSLGKNASAIAQGFSGDPATRQGTEEATKLAMLQPFGLPMVKAADTLFEGYVPEMLGGGVRTGYDAGLHANWRDNDTGNLFKEVRRDARNGTLEANGLVGPGVADPRAKFYAQPHAPGYYPGDSKASPPTFRSVEGLAPAAPSTQQPVSPWYPGKPGLPGLPADASSPAPSGFRSVPPEPSPFQGSPTPSAAPPTTPAAALATAKGPDNSPAGALAAAQGRTIGPAGTPPQAGNGQPLASYSAPTPTYYTPGGTSQSQSGPLSDIMASEYGMALLNRAAYGTPQQQIAAAHAIAALSGGTSSSTGPGNVTPGSPEQATFARPTGPNLADLIKDPGQLMTHLITEGKLDPGSAAATVGAISRLNSGDPNTRLSMNNPDAALLANSFRPTDNPATAMSQAAEHGLFRNGQITTPDDEAFARSIFDKAGPEAIRAELNAPLQAGALTNGIPFLGNQDVDRRLAGRPALQALADKYIQELYDQEAGPVSTVVPASRPSASSF